MRLVTAMLLALPLAGALAEEPDQPARISPETRVLELTLGRVAALALINSVQVRRAVLSDDVARGELRQALSEFDPQLFGTTRYQRDTPSPGPDQEGDDVAGLFLGLLGGGGSSSKSDGTVFELGVRTKHQLGGTIELRYTSERTRDLSGGGSDSLFSFFSVSGPTWTNRARISATQPLLRGFGLDVNRAGIRRAQIGRELAQLEAEEARRQVVSRALQAYWELTLAIRDLRIAQDSIKRAEKALEVVKARLGAGVSDRREVLRAEVGVAQRKESAIDPARRVRDAEDRLKQLILPADRPFLGGLRLVPKREVGYKSEPVGLGAAIALAMRQRPDVLQARARRHQADITYRASRNQRLPQLDVNGSFGFEGKGNTWDNGNRQLTDTRFRSWDLGLTLEVPLGNRGAKGAIQAARGRLEQAQLDVDEAEQRVVIEVRAAAREVASALRRIELARRSRELTQQQLDFAVDRLGKTEDVDVKRFLDFEEDLAQQLRRELQAVISFKQAKVRLAEATASLGELVRRASHE